VSEAVSGARTSISGFGLPDQELDVFQKRCASHLQYLAFFLFPKFELCFLHPETQIRNIRTIAKFFSETAAPADKFLCELLEALFVPGAQFWKQRGCTGYWREIRKQVTHLGHFRHVDGQLRSLSPRKQEEKGRGLKARDYEKGYFRFPEPRALARVPDRF
jgi:hypothetical protein